MAVAKIELCYVGRAADDHQLDFYDTASALVGFQRSLAITTHALLHGEVITQAPALRNATILIEPPEAGSWKILATVTAGLFALGTASKDTPIGNLVRSGYDYVVSETLGFHVDYDKTLGQQYEDVHKAGYQIPILTPARMESVIEKCEVPIRDMHRPIVKSQTAIAASLISVRPEGRAVLGHQFNLQTYEYMLELRPRLNDTLFEGRVSGYNMNTFKGRIFLGEAERPVSFELGDEARNPVVISAITRSLAYNAGARRSPEGLIHLRALPLETRTGRLKSLVVLGLAETLI
jgi:hypothetical protein